MKNTSIIIAGLATLNAVLAGWLILDKANSAAEPEAIFADTIDQMRFDGRVVQIDLARSRIPLTDGRRPPHEEREVVAKLVLTADAALLLHAGMNKAFAARPPIRTPPQAL